jgi:protein-disulfide isomerase
MPAHAPSRPPGERRRRLILLAAVAALAAVLVIVAIVVGQAGGEDETAADRPAASELAGIQQEGIVLGDPDAPVTLEEFADIQCPFCAQYANDVQPTLVREYVRTGRVRMIYRNLAFLGPDSELAARFAAAAGRQDRQWQALELLFARQGPENSGWVTEDMLRSVAGEIEGLDADRAFQDLYGPDVERQIRASRERAERFDIASTPSFLVYRRGEDPERLEPESLTPDAFRGTLDGLLEEAG